jgi:RNase P subunit RPR2
MTMRDLICHHCRRVLVTDFWALVEAETVPTFSRFCLTCSCGEVVEVDPVGGRRHKGYRPFGRLPAVPAAIGDHFQ